MADDNVIWGTDFKGNGDQNFEALIDRVDAKLDHLLGEMGDCVKILRDKGWVVDTSPCDYVAPSDDCA